MSHPLQLLLLLSFIITAAKLAGAAANRLGQPSVFGEILIGLLMGPTLLNILGWPLFAPAAGAPQAGDASLLATVRDLADVGVILLMFIAGLETDLEEMRRVGKVAFWSAAGGVVLPFIGGILVVRAFGYPVFWQGIFVGTILTATSVSISAQTLMELGQLRSREGATILGAAVIDDVMGIILLSVVVALARASGSVDTTEIGIVVLRMVVFFAITIPLGRYFARVADAASRLGVSQGLLAIVLVVAFLYGWAAEYFGGVAAITGSYIAGVLFAQTKCKKEIDAGVHPLTYSMLVPVFFVSLGLRANGRELGEQAAFTVTLVVVAIVTKALGCGLLAHVFGFSNLQSVRVGLGMISRGEVGLIVASYGLANGIIDQASFSASVIVVLVTTMITPPLLRLVFPAPRRYERQPVEETIVGPPEEAL